MALSLVDVSKNYGPVTALRAASLTVQPGECRGLFGGNGSGKSTIARIVGGAVRRSAGVVEIDGRELDVARPQRARALGVGITFQELSLMPDLNVAENVVIGDIPRRWGLFRNPRRVREAARRQLEEMSLAHLVDVKVGVLQTGEKYLVEFAKALYLRPKYIVVDELTTTLHASEVEIFSRLLSQHLASGGGVLFVSHRLDELRRFCSTITVLKNGSVVSDCSLGEVTDEQLVSWAGGRDAPAAPPALRTIRAGAEAPAVEISNVRLFASGPVVNLAFEKGQVVGLGGLPDQGQKQLLRILAGLEGEPSGAARVTLAGEALPLGSAVGVASRGVAFVSGDRDEVTFGQRSIRENMRAPFIARRGAATPDAGALIQALARLSARYAGLDMPLASLSGGNQQKVLVARCLIADPKLIVAEDPTKGIDVAARADVHGLLRDLVNETGATVVVTSSDDLELANLCDRILVFEGGRVVADLSRLDGTLSVEALVSAYMKQEMAA